MPLQPGTKLGPYEILAPIGAGNGSEVYKVSDPRLNRTVAIRVLPPDRAASRIERESRAIASLGHPQICALLDIGHEDGVDFLVTEYLEGQTLPLARSAGPRLGRRTRDDDLRGRAWKRRMGGIPHVLRPVR